LEKIIFSSPNTRSIPAQESEDGRMDVK